MKTTDFNFDLPEELIAQSPLSRRDASRLLCMQRQSGALLHKHFYELPELLQPGDLLVLNDSRVLPARLIGKKEPTGAAIELLLLSRKQTDVWEVLARPGRKALPGVRFCFGDGLLRAEVLEVLEGGNRLVRFFWQGEFYSVLDKVGQVPLPHYISGELAENERYQTVYSRELGSAAAPTAGLHFTPELLEKLYQKGVDTTFVTLHVGLGTFRPVQAEDIADHHMHTEYYQLPAETAEKINKTKCRGGRVIAVGTTSCRTLESVAQKRGGIMADEGETNIFLYPGCKFAVLDGLITNFHLPQSTLIMLVSAFAGYENTQQAYRTAVEEKYRFYSFGDAMFIV